MTLPNIDYKFWYNVNYEVNKFNEKEPLYKTMEDAGHAQWYDFSLKNTPDVRKKGVTDISKYYSGLQKSS